MKIEIKELKKSFGEKQVLKGITFESESGKAVGLLGRNGAGKTTSIRIIMGVFFQDSGEILVDGKKIERDKIRIGYLPEERGLYPKQKIGEQLVYFGKLRGLSKQQAREASAKWLDRMGMTEYKDKKLDTLSDNDVVLISEGCTHHRQCGDIGTVKLPAWIRKYTGKNIRFEFTSGTEFPAELSKYSMIIHCGGCMLNEREMKYRIKCAADASIPITNYGMTIAYVNGILKKSLEIFPEIESILN